jgi:hypothetical protein
VQDPSDKVVDVLAGRVTLVTALVAACQLRITSKGHAHSRNDPKTSTEKTSHESVGSVESDLGSSERSLANVTDSSAGFPSRIIEQRTHNRDKKDSMWYAP